MPSPDTFELSFLSGAKGFRIKGAEMRDFSGQSVLAAGAQYVARQTGNPTILAIDFDVVA